jgi:hypothetical protein
LGSNPDPANFSSVTLGNSEPQFPHLSSDLLEECMEKHSSFFVFILGMEHGVLARDKYLSNKVSTKQAAQK